jgi:drug/metabolite transporter (DMT)-like permease
LQFVFAAAALGLISRVFEPMPRLEPVSRWSAADALWLLALAGPATALAYGLYYRLLVKVAPAQAASTQWLQFAVTVTESAAISQQRPPLLMLAGLAVLLVCAARMLLVPVREEVPVRLADRR